MFISIQASYINGKQLLRGIYYFNFSWKSNLLFQVILFYIEQLRWQLQAACEVRNSMDFNFQELF